MITIIILILILARMEYVKAKIDAREWAALSLNVHLVDVIQVLADVSINQMDFLVMIIILTPILIHVRMDNVWDKVFAPVWIVQPLNVLWASATPWQENVSTSPMEQVVTTMIQPPPMTNVLTVYAKDKINVPV
jgi:hypothetical protein